jgi:hypothetical protein
MSAPVKTYLKQIGENLRAGNATEHTHRPALIAVAVMGKIDVRGYEFEGLG